MLPVSQTYNDLLASEDKWFVRSLAIDNRSASTGIMDGDGLLDVSAEYFSFSGDQPTVGGCVSSELTATILKPDFIIPRMARVRLYVKLTNGTISSEWLPQGVFLIDTREETRNDDGRDIIKIHAYDYMLKAEAMYPSSSGSWPKSDVSVVKEIAYTLGLQTSRTGTAGIDARTWDTMTHNYQISTPAGYTMREVLSYIAAMYAGNWIMTYEGKLLLVPLNSFPKETSLLIDELGNVITWGEDAISLADTTEL